MIFRVETIKAASVIEGENYIIKISLSGSLVMQLSDDLSYFLETLISGGAKKILLDIKDLEYIDSMGIGSLIKITKQVRTNGGDLAFVNTPQNIEDVFKLVHLKDFIKNFRFEKQAIDYFFSISV